MGGVNENIELFGGYMELIAKVERREVSLKISRVIVPILMNAEVSNEVIEKVLLAIEREST